MIANSLIQELNSSQNPQYIEEQQQQSKLSYKSIKTLRFKKAKCIVCKKMCNYTCPKCKHNYCGIQHYRSHNLFCSQKFYEQQVTENLKGLKITDKNQKKKAIQIVKNYQQQIQNQSITFDITVQRLQQILAQIQQGKDAKLTQKQQYLFNKYLDSLNKDEKQFQNRSNNEQNGEQIAQIEKPYWQIQDGMGIYLLKQTQIQQYGDSEYPQIIAQRQLFKKRLEQFNQIHPFSQSIFKPVINLHLVQIIYQFVTLFRAFDGQYQQFALIFAKSYTSNQNQHLLKIQNISIKNLIQQIELQIIKAFHQINGITANEDNIIKVWINQYYEIVWADIIKILRNKNLILQTLFRIIDITNFIYKQNNQTLNPKDILEIANKVSRDEIKNKKQTKQQKFNKIMKIKIVKKCEYLLYFVQSNYKQHIIQQIMHNFLNQKNMQKQKTKKQQHVNFLINKSTKNY